MKTNGRFVERNGFVLAGMLLGSVLANDPVSADDIEIYTAALNGGFEEQVRPNILYVIDTSGSMDNSFYSDPAQWWQRVPAVGIYAGLAGPYDSSKDYSAFGTCDKDTVYYIEPSSSEIDPGTGKPWVNADGYPVESAGTNEINLPECDSNHFPQSALACEPAIIAFTTGNTGWYDDFLGSYWPLGPDLGGRTMDGEWHNFLTEDHNGVGIHNGGVLWRECRADYGIHGGGPDAATMPYPNDASNSETNPWTSSLSDAYDSHLDNNHYILADGNFLNWFYYVNTRIAAVQSALSAVLADLPDETNVGLMRFDSSAGAGGTDGGMMIKEFVTIGEGTNRADLIAALYTIPQELDASTPLSETLYEAFLVFAGDKVYFGAGSENESGLSQPSIMTSRNPSDPSRYLSPISASCQQNAIVYFTDGAPSSDINAFDGISDADGSAGWDGGFDRLPGLDDADHPDYAPIGPYLFSNGVYECNDDEDELGCLPTLAAYMYNEDVNSNVPGKQTVTTHTIGFSDPGDSDQVDPDYLQLTANQGGGKFALVTDNDDLKDAFKVVTRKAVASNTAFTAPALAVNAFNRTQDENIVLLAMFRSATTPGWGGNLKAYQFGIGDDGEVELQDAIGEPAVDPDTGNFHFDARSIWSAEDDGNEAVEGGAASNLPATRTLYTWFESTALPASLVDAAAAFVPGNSNFTDAMFGLDGTESYGREDVIEWMSGIDVLDQDGDGETTDYRYHMGDPLHSRPAIVTYGPSATDRQQKAFLTTNDGFLHIIDMETGREVFGFVALETLKNAKRMFEADSSKGKAYGLDGAPVLWIDEGASFTPGINQDGETDDTVYLYVGMRRGGRSYYAFDVTSPASPKLLWRIEGGDLDGDGVADANEGFYYLGQTWSTPQRGQVRINNQVRDILVFGGGYDTIQDDPDEDPGTTSDGYAQDRYGNAIYIVDAKTGERLWWASSAADANLVIADMKNAIPSDVALVDADADGWSDRIYVGDMGGRLFRIDISETNATSLSATGGMIADLGASNVTDDTTTGGIDEAVQASRKFFYPPDVVVVENGSNDYIALALGSGARNHPSYPSAGDTAVQDAFFVLRDFNILNPPAGNDYNYGITFDSLHDATTDDDVPDDAEGWYIRMTHEGEKVLAGAITFNYQTLFTSFEPQDIDLANCQARTGIGRVYAVDLRTSKAINPAFHVDEEGGETGSELTIEDRAYELARDGIPPAPTIMFPEANDGDSLPMVGTEKIPFDPGPNRHKAYWYIKKD